LIFIASPLTAPDPGLVQKRVAAAGRFGAWVQSNEGKCAFVAAAHDHAIATHLAKPMPYDWWRANIHHFMAPAQSCYVLCLDGWEQSKGVAVEIEIAEQLGKPIHYYDVVGEGYQRRDHGQSSNPSPIRPYRPADYAALTALYQQGEFYGGQFDLARDAPEKLAALAARDPQSLLVYEQDGHIKGTVSLIENGRVAWLFRFAVPPGPQHDQIAQALYDAAAAIFRARGHTQMLVYSDPENAALNTRYAQTLGLQTGGLYRCFWADL
jgi:ribosomal protein S18 acetylase RimI-like enzyme